MPVTAQVCQQKDRISVSGSKYWILNPSLVKPAILAVVRALKRHKMSIKKRLMQLNSSVWYSIDWTQPAQKSNIYSTFLCIFLAQSVLVVLKKKKTTTLWLWLPTVVNSFCCGVIISELRINARCKVTRHFSEKSTFLIVWETEKRWQQVLTVHGWRKKINSQERLTNRWYWLAISSFSYRC